MKVLLTGNKGFVGSHIETALRAEGHEIVGLEVASTFREWQDVMQRVVTPDIEAVVHAGAIPHNQSKDPSIYLWNAHATYLLAEQAYRIVPDVPFILFSTFLVSCTQDEWHIRTPYTWSKVCAEQYVRQWMPHATALRPGSLWGNEHQKGLTEASVPYQLASHRLAKLFRHWGRSYVHVLDLCEAIKVCLKDSPVGVFELHTEYKTNQELAGLVQWQGYEWVEHPESLGYVKTEHQETNIEPILPNWKPKIFLADELPKMERGL